MAETFATKTGRLTPIPQEDDATCWKAAYQMMLQWKGKPLDLIDTAVKSVVTKWNECYKLGLDKSDWDRVGKALGMTTIAGSKPFTAKALADYISHGPVLLHGKFGLGIHSIVITEVTVAGLLDSSDIETAGYINPHWVGEKKVRPRVSSFKDYVKLGVENQVGIAGVLQHW